MPTLARRATGVLLSGAALTLLATTAAPAAAAPAAAAQDGTVYVVHGIPDTPVDVYVDGQRALDDFEPGTSQGPVSLPSGAREVAVFPADAPSAEGSPLLSGTAEIPSGGSATLVAHLTPQGQPTLTPFVNEVGAIPAGQARVVARHTAAAPAVDVLSSGQAVVSGLTNPNQEALEVPAATLSAAVAAAGTTEPVIGPADLTLEEGTTTFVHAIGSLEQRNLELVTFTVSGSGSAPSGVPAGAPSGVPGSGAPDGWTMVSLFGLVVVGASLWRLRRTRTR